jgi:hypothetical protein
MKRRSCFWRRPLVVLLSALCALLVGCGARKTSPVQGRVWFQDGGDVQTLVGHKITFESEADRMSSYGQIDPDGTFQITTFTTNDGALPGRHRVAIAPPSPQPDAASPKPVIPNKFNDPATSGITVEIKPGTNSVELEPERAP